MKKFSFSMEKILDIRTFEKKQAESELSMAMMKEREIQAQIDSLTEKRALCVIDAEKSTDFSVIVNSQKYLKFIAVFIACNCTIIFIQYNHFSRPVQNFTMKVSARKL